MKAHNNINILYNVVNIQCYFRSYFSEPHLSVYTLSKIIDGHVLLEQLLYNANDLSKTLKYLT